MCVFMQRCRQMSCHWVDGEQRNHVMHMHEAISRLGINHSLVLGWENSLIWLSLFVASLSFFLPEKPKKEREIKTELVVSGPTFNWQSFNPPGARKHKPYAAVCSWAEEQSRPWRKKPKPKKLWQLIWRVNFAAEITIAGAHLAASRKTFRITTNRVSLPPCYPSDRLSRDNLLRSRRLHLIFWLKTWW